MRTTGRNLVQDFAQEYAKRARAKAALASTSWHNNVLNRSESLIVQHAPWLIARRRQLTLASDRGLDESRWLQEVECFINEVIDPSGGFVRSSLERLLAVKWMIASATAQFACTAPDSLEWQTAVAETAA